MYEMPLDFIKLFSYSFIKIQKNVSEVATFLNYTQKNTLWVVSYTSFSSNAYEIYSDVSRKLGFQGYESWLYTPQCENISQWGRIHINKA